jgi:hypothetical protein
MADPQTGEFNSTSVVAYISCRRDVLTNPLPNNEKKDALYLLVAWKR